jgi:CheY-like chemotaxis protein
MMDNRSSGEAGGTPPAEFVEAVKDALDHLYDFTRLTDHPLAGWLLRDDLPRGVSHAQALRQRLAEAIERMNPGRQLANAAREKRAFHLLELRYVEAMPYREVMETLALSQTQYHREQRHAVEMVATYLWDTRPLAVGTGLVAARYAAERAVGLPASDEVPLPVEAAIDGGNDDVPLASFLAEIVELVEQVGGARGIRIRAGATDDVTISTNRTVLRNAVISAISGIVSEAREGEMIVTGHRRGAMAGIEIRHRGSAPARLDSADEKLRVAAQLTGAIGGTLAIRSDAGPEVVATLTLPIERPTLLVVDDNPDLVQLIRRYLVDQPYTVLSAGTVEEGVGMAQSSRPDVILLDVMLPHRDGWDALQLLRHHPVTGEIPIVICSVLGEEQLARALGAATFIRKPLTRPALLQALETSLAWRRPTAAAGPGAPAHPGASERWESPDR